MSTLVEIGTHRFRVKIKGADGSLEVRYPKRWIREENGLKDTRMALYEEYKQMYSKDTQIEVTHEGLVQHEYKYDDWGI